MKKNILFRAALLLITIAVCEPTMAEKISLSQAKTIANRFAGTALSNGNANGQKVTSALSLAYKSQSEELYAFNVGQGSGFVLVAGDDLVKNPVLGYCDEGSFNYDQLEGPAKGWVEQYAQTIAYARANNIVVESSAALASESNKSVGPLLTTKWAQYPVYNELCPKIGEELLPTGCAATALAQIMKYYNYPEHGIGSLDYSTSTRYKGVKYDFDCFADFEHTTYDWANMPEVCDSSSTAVQINAVATLMYHCGVAQKTKYGYYGSSVSDDNYMPALTKYFGYDKSAQFEESDFYTLEEWTDSLKRDLDAGRPVLYNGNDEYVGGHAFVMDGYNAEGYFHFNWGWGGEADGYFSLLKMQPNEDTPGFNSSHRALMHIMPDQGGEARCEALLFVIYSKEDTVNLDTCGGMVCIIGSYYQINADTMDVTAYLTLENKADGGTQDLVKQQLRIPPWRFKNIGQDKFCDFNGVKDGDYKLWPTYETSNVSKRKVRGRITNQGYLDVTVKNGIVTIGEDKETGIHKVPNSPNAAAKGDSSIFNLSGQKVGTNWEKLTPGIYLMDGEKKFKK